MSDQTTGIDYGEYGARADLADQYVLGTLDPETARLIATAIEVDIDWRNAVVASQERFLPLDLTAESLTLDPELWSRIEQRLNELAAQSGTPYDSSPAGTASPVTIIDPVAARIPPETSAPRDSANDNTLVATWRRRAIAASVISLLAVGSLFWSVTRTAEPTVIAVLLNAQNEPQVLIEDFGGRTAKVTLLTDYDVPDDRNIQLWTLPNRDMGPISLGLLAPGDSVTLDLANLPAPVEQQLYEITLEQRGGSPTGRPTGPILAKGFAKQPR